jgi:anti-sigma B factor antagonist
MRLADLEVSMRDGIAVARLVGEIDMSNADELRIALASAMPTDARAMVLDLSGVDYLDSAGIRLIYLVSEDFGARRQRTHVVAPPDSVVADVLRIAGVIDHIGAAPTLDEALVAARAG